MGASSPSPSSLDVALRAATRVLCVGIGGGGDVVGAVAFADLAARFDAGAVVGGITWERLPVDPIPGPRRIDELTGAEVLNEAVALAGPETEGPGGFLFAESRVAEHLGEPTVLVDPNPGPRAVAAGIDDACERLGCDLVALIDVGGDVLAHGDERGLGSPLADAVLLAAAAHMRTPSVGAIFGAGCDGELTIPEVLERLAELAAHDGLLGTWGPPPAAVARLATVVRAVPTEASAAAVLCARGRTGRHSIREGRRSLELSPVGGLVFVFDPLVALRTAARLADAVRDAASLEDADRILGRMGVSTELSYERTRSR